MKLHSEIITSINFNEETSYDTITKEIMKRENSIKETYLIKNEKFPFFDTTPHNSISLINLNSIADFESKINKSIEYSRFRGNIYVNNLKAWKEFDYIGQNLIINDCKFKITGKISRCSATNLSPHSVEADINLQQKLKLKLTDKYNKSIEQAFNILVLLSPCETTDSTQHTIKIK